MLPTSQNLENATAKLIRNGTVAGYARSALDIINLIGLLDGIIGLDYWMVFFTQTLTWPAARRGIPRRGVFLFLLFYVIFFEIVINGQKM